jgi:tRNA (adenine57-N1/adenine58-N1)-methyltransferase
VDKILEGQDILLWLDRERTYMVKVEAGKQFHTHKGFLLFDDLIGKPWGSSVSTNLGATFYALPPLIRDRVLKTDRRTQVLYPKDIGYILYQLGIGNGSKVVEAGTGSGALTMSLANAVKPDGKIFTYEIDERSQKIAATNIERAGLSNYVEMKLGDVCSGISEEGVDAVILDLATPWLIVPHVWKALAGGGVFISFSPTIEQVMKTVYEIEDHTFIDIETIELILRRITVAENRTRPETLMMGHSGYLTTARKVIPYS